MVARREQDGGGAGRGDGPALVGRLQLEVDRGAAAVGEVLAHDGAGEVVDVADVVEPAERALELPQPGVVAHPVGAEVDEPRLAHAAVVERGGVARAAGGGRGAMGAPQEGGGGGVAAGGGKRGGGGGAGGGAGGGGGGEGAGPP